MNKLIILSDIHANLTALRAVLSDISSKYKPDAFILLGDIINYGMHPNEVIDELKHLNAPILINLMGNHEKSLCINDTSRFSTERGKVLLDYTYSTLTKNSLLYIHKFMNPDGMTKLEIKGKKFLFLHGNIDDPYWGKLIADHINDFRYSSYDYVFSGHTHKPHYMEYYFEANCPQLRNKKKTVYINPGSVGQPRNQNPMSQYVYMEINNNIIHYNSVIYDIETETASYPDFLDIFYKERLFLGI